MPYVLVLIAIVAVIAMGAADRLQQTSGAVAGLRAAQDARAQAHSAFAGTTFVLLTSSPESEGFDLGGNLSSDEALFAGVTDTEGSRNREIWVPDGAVRRDGDIEVSLRDASGLLSLTQASEADLVTVLANLNGVTPQQARQLAASLADYQDVDSRKRFGGAEAGDYRRAGRAEPPNAPLRSFGEVWGVMGWADIDRRSAAYDLAETVSALSLEGVVRIPFAHPRLKALGLARDEVDASQVDIFSTLPTVTEPSPVTRVDIRVPGNVPWRLLADVKRRPQGLERPFETDVVIDSASRTRVTTSTGNGLQLRAEADREQADVPESVRGLLNPKTRSAASDNAEASVP